MYIVRTVKGMLKNSNKIFSETGEVLKVANIFIPRNVVYEGYFLIKMLDEKWCKIIRKVVVNQYEENT